MLPYFKEEELDPLKVVKADAGEKNTYLIAIFQGKKPISFIEGYGFKNGYGAIGYIATDKKHRRKGLATSVLDMYEKELGNDVKLILAEAVKGSRLFWGSVGFRLVAGVTYFSPPIEFDPKTGKPIHPEVKEQLRVKPSGDIDKKCLADGVRTMCEEWYTPEEDDFDTKGAYKEAENYVSRIIERNLNSIENLDKIKLKV